VKSKFYKENNLELEVVVFEGKEVISHSVLPYSSRTKSVQKRTPTRTSKLSPRALLAYTAYILKQPL
jgi:hypothetical protein